MIKEKKEEIKKASQDGFNLIGIESKRLKILVLTLGLLFTLFLITAFITTIENSPSIMWWILSLITGMTLCWTVIFKR